MRALHRPAFQVQWTTRWPRLRAARHAIGLARNRHSVGIDEALVAAIGQRQPGENIDFAFTVAPALLHLRNIVRLPVETRGNIS